MFSSSLAPSTTLNVPPNSSAPPVLLGDKNKVPELTLTVPVFCRAAPPILLLPVPVVCACSTPRFSSTLPVPVELPTEAFVMLNVPLVSLMNREALLMRVLNNVAAPWLVRVVASRIKFNPVSALVTVMPPVPVTVPNVPVDPEPMSRRLTEKALGPELSVPKPDRPSTPVVLRFNAAEDVNW